MENILGLIIFAVVLSTFYTSTTFLFFGYFIAITSTVGLHLYDCFAILQVGIGSCQMYQDVIGDVSQNMAAVAGAYVLLYTGLAIIKKFIPRL